MKINMGKQLFCCLLAAFFVLCCFPLQSMAAEQPGTIVFSTFEELRSYCDEAADFSGGSLSCEEADLLISEDMVIPPGRTVVFRYFTVPEGITLTIMEGAELMTYGLTVRVSSLTMVPFSRVICPGKEKYRMRRSRRIFRDMS